MMPTVDLFLVYITKSSLKYGFNSLLFNLDTPLGDCTESPAQYGTALININIHYCICAVTLCSITKAVESAACSTTCTRPPHLFSSTRLTACMPSPPLRARPPALRVMVMARDPRRHRPPPGRSASPERTPPPIDARQPPDSCTPPPRL